ncbi:MAG: hypothetical protein Q4C29_02740 [bacterium]|nr:hypothetical protein [bacterium]
MKREELKKKIRGNEEIIIKKLESNNIGSYTEYMNGKKVHSNKEYGKCISYFYKGFFDNYYNDLKEKINFNSNYSMENYMNNKFLEYKLVYTYEIIKYLDKNYIFGKEDLQGLKDYSRNLGVILRKEYVKEVGNTPLRDFIYMNSTSYLKEHLEEKIEKFSNYDENNLRFNTLKYRSILQKELPKKFKEKEAYGRLIGALNESFYGEKNSEILEALKRNKIKVSDKNIIDFMNKDHLIYRLVAFNFINSYIKKYDSLECNDFHKKVLSLGTILKDIFKESFNNSPLYDLITNAKEKELVENPKYKLSKENSTIIVDNSIQISMFDKKDENIR